MWARRPSESRPDSGGRPPRSCSRSRCHGQRSPAGSGCPQGCSSSANDGWPRASTGDACGGGLGERPRMQQPVRFHPVPALAAVHVDGYPARDGDGALPVRRDLVMRLLFLVDFGRSRACSARGCSFRLGAVLAGPVRRVEPASDRGQGVGVAGRGAGRLPMVGSPARGDGSSPRLGRASCCAPGRPG
jgi:hypothetical protein